MINSIEEDRIECEDFCDLFIDENKKKWLG
jgi:hypothetical protein